MSLKNQAQTALSGVSNFLQGRYDLYAAEGNLTLHSELVTLVSGFNAVDRVQLMPIGGCQATPPASVACTCTTANCQ